jgi:hypothetical protein
MKLSISEIVQKAIDAKDNEAKIAVLKQYDCAPLRTILKNMYDKDNVKFLIPDTPPPWKKNDYVGVEGMLYKEARRIRIFVEGGGYDNLNQVKREQLFISLLEDIDNADAELLCKMIAQKPLKGLPKSVVYGAFPEDYTENFINKSENV